jgi:hypothetical protein
VIEREGGQMVNISISEVQAIRLLSTPDQALFLLRESDQILEALNRYARLRAWLIMLERKIPTAGPLLDKVLATLVDQALQVMEQKDVIG